MKQLFKDCEMNRVIKILMGKYSKKLLDCSRCSFKRQTDSHLKNIETFPTFRLSFRLFLDAFLVFLNY